MNPRHPLLVVFDLDETLIHASARVSSSHADFMSGQHACIIRPYARELIAECLDRYDVGVWTSAGSFHADAVVEALFSETRGPSFVWSAAQCTPHRDFDTMNEVSVKNLHKLRRRGVDLDRVVAIDDSPEKHRRNYGNLLGVHPWEVRIYLRWLARHPSVRTVEKRGRRRQPVWTEPSTDGHFRDQWARETSWEMIADAPGETAEARSRATPVRGTYSRLPAMTSPAPAINHRYRERMSKRFAPGSSLQRRLALESHEVGTRAGTPTRNGWRSSGRSLMASTRFQTQSTFSLSSGRPSTDMPNGRRRTTVRDARFLEGTF